MDTTYKSTVLFSLSKLTLLIPLPSLSPPTWHIEHLLQKVIEGHAEQYKKSLTDEEVQELREQWVQIMD